MEQGYCQITRFSRRAILDKQHSTYTFRVSQKGGLYQRRVGACVSRNLGHLCYLTRALCIRHLPKSITTRVLAESRRTKSKPCLSRSSRQRQLPLVKANSRQKNIVFKACSSFDERELALTCRESYKVLFRANSRSSKPTPVKSWQYKS